MASNNLNIIGQMKQDILKTILSDEDVVKLISNQPNSSLPATDLRYKQVFPWAYVPDTTEQARTFVTFEIFVTSVQSCAVKTFELRIYCISHESLMKIDKSVCDKLNLPLSDCGSRIDTLADKIDFLINGSEELGFGTTDLLSSPTSNPAADYHGRVLIYRVQGWNRHGDQL